MQLPSLSISIAVAMRLPSGEDSSHAVLQVDERGVPQRVHCVQPLWHQPLDAFDDPRHHLPNVGHGYISTDGCLFPCRCAAFLTVSSHACRLQLH
jgi:hypothetical protein